MKTRKLFNEPDDATKKPVKTLSLQVAVSEPDFQKMVREAFDLAKSAGRELDLAFILPSDIGTAPLAAASIG